MDLVRTPLIQSSNPPINLLPSPLTILSPVSMRAVSGDEVEVTFEVADGDFDSNVADTTVVANSSKDTFNMVADLLRGSNTKAGLIEYVGDLDYINSDLANVIVTVETYVESESGYHRVDKQVLRSNALDCLQVENALKVLSDGDSVDFVITPMIDYLGNGYAYTPKTVAHQDGVDDRDQTVVTILEEGWNDRTDKGTGKYAKSYYVADDNDTLEAIIKGLSSYDARQYAKNEDGKRETYRLVYYVNDDEVEAVWEVRADKDDKRIVWNSTPSTNDKDTNGDGKVSCDEYYGTTGLEWSDKLNACVVSSTGDAVVTIPNTATK